MSYYITFDNLNILIVSDDFFDIFSNNSSRTRNTLEVTCEQFKSISFIFYKFIIYYKRSLLSNDQQLFNMPLRARMHQPTIMDGGGPNLTVW